MANRIIRIKIPLPFPLRWVNGYVIDAPDGSFTLIDPGLNTDKARQAWTEWMEATGHDPSRLDQIVLTHHHPDHYGLAGWMQELSGAPVRMASKGLEQARLLWGPERTMSRRMLDLFNQHGLPSEMQGEMETHMEDFIDQVSPQPKVAPLEPGESIVMGGATWQVAEVSGHAYGHLVFYEPISKSLIVGDHVLPQITPNVAYLPGIDENPLASFLVSLKDIQRFDAELAYPGHRDPFDGLADRAEAIIRHHEERLERIEGRMREAGGTGMTAYEVCTYLFGTRLSTHQLRFALSETIAHLIYLEKENRCIRIDAAGGNVRYQV